VKWLITGGAGFIGTNTAAALLRDGERCVLADNFHRHGARYNQDYLREHFRLPVDYLDVRFHEQVTAYWAAHRDIDVILHLAGQVSLLASLAHPRYDFEANALGTFNVLEATRRFLPDAKVIYAWKTPGHATAFRIIPRAWPKTCRSSCTAAIHARKARPTTTCWTLTASTA
jgi:CDP-paratose 2-epimerase